MTGDAGESGGDAGERGDGGGDAGGGAGDSGDAGGDAGAGEDPYAFVVESPGAPAPGFYSDVAASAVLLLSWIHLELDDVAVCEEINRRFGTSRPNFANRRRFG